MLLSFICYKCYNYYLDDIRRAKEHLIMNPGHPLPSSAYQPIASSIVSGTVASAKVRCSTHMDTGFKCTRPSSPIIGITVPPKKQHLHERQAVTAAANLNTGPPQPSLSAQSLTHTNAMPSYPGAYLKYNLKYCVA